MGKLANFANQKFLELSELEIIGIFQIGKLTNFLNFYFEKLSEFEKLSNFGIVHSFDIPHHSHFFRFSYFPGRGQHLERPKVERPIFRNFETLNTKITKVESFDFPIFEFIFYYYIFLKFFEHLKYTYDNLLNSKFLEYW